MPTAPAVEKSLPGRVGRYQLISQIGAGGMGSVYLAVARGAGGFERLVAIKVCEPRRRSDPEFVAMFLDEARLAAKLRHPHIVPTLDVEDGAVLYLVMEYVEGGSLSALEKEARARRKPMPLPIVVRIALDALAGLAAAHEFKDEMTGAPLGIVHRDVSPQNILVGADGSSRIVDFGIALAESRAVVTREGQLKGKPGYFAPEQASGGRATPRTDVFTMGIVVWEAITGTRLYQGESPMLMIEQIVNVDATPPSLLRDDIPAGLDAAVLGALRRDEARRWASAADFSAALERSGVTPATPREVAAYVDELLGHELEARRKRLRAPRSASLWDPSVSEVPEAFDTTAAAAADDLTAAPRPDGATASTAAAGAIEPRPAATPWRSPRKLGGFVAGMSAAIGLALVGWVIARTTSAGDPGRALPGAAATAPAPAPGGAAPPTQVPSTTITPGATSATTAPGAPGAPTASLTPAPPPDAAIAPAIGAAAAAPAAPDASLPDERDRPRAAKAAHPPAHVGAAPARDGHAPAAPATPPRSRPAIDAGVDDFPASI